MSEVDRRIAAAKAAGSTTLDLSELDLTSLPLEIGSLVELTGLDLRANRLTSLPSEIGSLANLTTLDLRRNQFTAFPPEIASLTKLAELNLRANKLTAFPPEIGSLAQLTELNLRANKLAAIPPEIGSLAKLTTLDLRRNQLTSLPPEIGSLAELTTLRLSGNALISLPAEIGSLANLTKLDLASNQLTLLPPEIGSLAKLTTLDLASNQLTLLPPEIGSLAQLTRLYLAGNQLASLPPEIGSMANLTTLDLNDNHLMSLPSEVGSLAKLARLYLAGNLLTSLPPETGSLANLATLNVRSNRLTSIPPQIGSLTNLNAFSLASNQLTSLPSEIGSLANLTTLILRRNHLTSLPSEIGSLAKLTNLDLRSNQLTSLPGEIGSLPASITELDLRNNQLTSLPPEIGSLANLTNLDLRSNQLTSLPVEISSLTNLTWLNLNGNQLTSLPPKISSLARLHLASNQLKSLPAEIGSLLATATVLDLSGNLLTSLPSEIGSLAKLTRLHVASNQLKSLPAEIGSLAKLTKLYLQDNQLTPLPPELGSLPNLRHLVLHNNPLESELDAANAEGTDALLRYLSERAKGEATWREAKLVLVGEGEVGKTCLLRALMGEPWKENLETTHGIDPKEMTVELPGDGKSVLLNAWDFGGQPVYRTTHQLFFSAPAVYLVVWKPREGPQQDFVEYWIELIKHRVGADARVIVVASHGGPDERQPDIDLQQLQDKFGKEFVLKCVHVDSKPDDLGRYSGISELKDEITRVASMLPDMANKYPTTWQDVRQALKESNAPFLPYDEVVDICTDHEMDSLQAELFLLLSHRRGRLIYYENDRLLGSIVILKPEWLAKAISFALDSKDIRSNHGLAQFSTLSSLWNDSKREPEDRYPAELHHAFLRLMERFDLSYQVTMEQSAPDDGYTSLIAQLAPDQRPTLPDWDQVPPGEQQLVQICRIVSTDRREQARAEGLFYMLIVRLHRYSLGRDDFRDSVHWQRGLMLDDSYNGRALLEHVGNDVRITVRAVYPEFFLSQLTREVKSLIDSFWDGLQCDIMVPCIAPCGRGKPGQSLFPLQKLIDSKKQGRPDFPCPDPECDRWQRIDSLLRNAPSPAAMPTEGASEEVKEHLVAIRRQLVTHDRNEKARFHTLTQNQRRIASRIDTWYAGLVQTLTDEAKDGPRLFSLIPIDPGFFNNPRWISHRFRLTLWCEHTRLPLPVVAGDPEAGVYEFERTRKWVRAFARGLKLLSTTISLVFPLAASATKFILDDAAYDRIEKELDLGRRAVDFAVKGAVELTGSLPDEASPDIERGEGARAEGAMLRELHALLKQEDATRRYGGLVRVRNSRGEFLWVHEQFRHEY
jgi:Leucine-rich repeat (LRR) protein